MTNTPPAKQSVTTKDLVTLALLSAILLVVQVALASLPNIEIVSLLIYIYTQVYRKKVFFIIYIFVFLEGCIYGFGLWWLGYLYVWSLLAIVILLIKDQRLKNSAPFAGVILGAYGLSYGFLFAIPYFIISGIHAGMAYWIAGIPFDLAHCAGNVVTALILYKPLRFLIERLKQH